MKTFAHLNPPVAAVYDRRVSSTRLLFTSAVIDRRYRGIAQ